MPEQEIRFSTRENDWVDLRCGKAHFNLVGLSSDEFPFFPAINESTFLTIKASLIRELVEMTAFAICHDETKYNLNGIFIKALEVEGRTLLRDGRDRWTPPGNGRKRDPCRFFSRFEEWGHFSKERHFRTEKNDRR
ncbi:MAG: hypothetical protein M0C28_21370 [Candidatus Moduliflexus flocculans]|nr:hypothetical protein [Candidatus Moduliflexus flocculans]